jgi:hypothetical protein
MRTEGMRNENAKEKHELGGEKVSSKPGEKINEYLGTILSHTFLSQPLHLMALL